MAGNNAQKVYKTDQQNIFRQEIFRMNERIFYKIKIWIAELSYGVMADIKRTLHANRTDNTKSHI